MARVASFCHRLQSKIDSLFSVKVSVPQDTPHANVRRVQPFHIGDRVVGTEGRDACDGWDARDGRQGTVVWARLSEGKLRYVEVIWDNHNAGEENHIIDVSSIRLAAKAAPDATMSVGQHTEQRKYVGDLPPIREETLEKNTEYESPDTANLDQENIGNAPPSKAAPDPIKSVVQYPQEPDRSRPPAHAEVFARAFPWYFPREGITNPCDLPFGGISFQPEGCRF